MVDAIDSMGMKDNTFKDKLTFVVKKVMKKMNSLILQIKLKGKMVDKFQEIEQFIKPLSAWCERADCGHC